MSLEQRIGELTGTLKTFMGQYERDRERDREDRELAREFDRREREEFRTEIKKDVATIKTEMTGLAARIGPLEVAKIQDDVPRHWWRTFWKWALSGSIVSAAGHFVLWLKQKFFSP